MKTIVRICFACLFLIFASQSAFALLPTTLKFCHEDENAFPWVFTHNGEVEGLDVRLIKLVESEIDIPIKLISLPWTRCLSFLKTDQVDGAFAASFKQERMSMGVYPTDSKLQLDSSKRIHTSSYSLYTVPASDLQWDGTRFINLKGKISAQLGFSIVDKLTKLGVSVREVKGPRRALSEVLSKLVEGAVIQTDRADFLLANSETLKNQLVKHPIALVEKPYYVMLSSKLNKNHPDLALLIWNTIEKIRESAEMQASTKEFWDLMDGE